MRINVIAIQTFVIQNTHLKEQVQGNRALMNWSRKGPAVPEDTMCMAGHGIEEKVYMACVAGVAKTGTRHGPHKPAGSGLFDALFAVSFCSPPTTFERLAF